MTQQNWMRRITGFVLVFGFTLVIIYGGLPWVTRSFDVLNRLSVSLEETGINPTSYYYTDVEQVIESEHYLETVLNHN